MNLIFSILIFTFPHLLFFFGVGWTSKYTKTDRMIVLLSTYFIILFQGFRYGVGYDYFSYDNFVIKQIQFLEPIPNFISWLSFYLTRQSWLFFILTSFFTLIFVYLSCKNTGNYFPYIAFISLPFFYIESFSIVRQGLAISICFFVYSDYLNKNFKRAFIFSFIALLSHISSFVFLIFILVNFLTPPKYRTKFIIFSIFTTLICSIFTEAIISYFSYYFPRLEFYSGEHKYGLKMAISLFFFSGIVFFLIDYKTFISILLALIIFIIAIKYDAVFSRIAYYFFIPFCFVSIQSLSRKKLLEAIIILYFIAIFIVKYLDYGNGFQSYNSILFDSIF